MAGAGGVHRLPRQIPLKQAMGMILTGRRVPAQEGKELGFVNEVVPAGQALEGAKRWAKLILECSPMSVRASKQAVYVGLDQSNLEGAVRNVYTSQRSEEHTSELQSLMRISYAVFCLKTKN